MIWLVWAGAVLTVLGLGGILWSVRLVYRARRFSETDEELRARLEKILPLNLGALAVSALGLITVVIGITFSG